MNIRLFFCCVLLNLANATYAQLEKPKTVHGLLVNYEALLPPKDRMDTTGLSEKTDYRQQLTDLILRHLDWLLDSAQFALLERSGLIRKADENRNQGREIHLRYMPGQSDTVSGTVASSPKFIHNMQIYGLFAINRTPMDDVDGNTTMLDGEFIDIRIHFSKQYSFDTTGYPDVALSQRHVQIAGAAVQIILSTDESKGKIRLFNKLVIVRGAYSFNEYLPTPVKPTMLTGIKIETGPEFPPGAHSAAVGFITNGIRDTFYVSSSRRSNLLQSFVTLASAVNGEKPADKKALDEEKANLEGLSHFTRLVAKHSDSPAGPPNE